MQTVSVEVRERTAIITIERPERRNAVDGATAQALYDAFKAFDADASLDVAVLQGRGGAFCAGADLKGVSEGRGNPVHVGGDLGPMGCTRLALSKPVIAAVEGHAVAGGLEVAAWCDLRVAAQDAVFGVFCRRFGVPLIDLGTVRLPRLIGHSRAMDLILTGRPVSAQEAFEIGLANRLAPNGEALAVALDLAAQISAFPQACLRNDRASAIAQWSMDWESATRFEVELGRATLASGEAREGAGRFASGEGRHGAF
ncbi:enoyl-CoA hydratase [Phenylobacterium sp. Root77]|uniref:crotonase/enoyl-CoA hydratase family protein n=1 Tax=unclassified Phenylobacterium TaxID=2640670 RepID=UPI0006F987F9|nr:MULTISPECIES: crotonase/enoyl-CoA hydratase family protein [unclassified Phenylobacterium]KQW73214.1 enoyl-CoA hydratase [Phenylobacterium sp. Root1277]KQW92434.1 enoyl-CoA hydratase [Phenylobacterium sp. Root1290]KRC40663.1 enoyl-CoA hydratase [Phenylobacterium sp. Root77]